MSMYVNWNVFLSEIYFKNPLVFRFEVIQRAIKNNKVHEIEIWYSWSIVAVSKENKSMN